MQCCLLWPAGADTTHALGGLEIADIAIAYRTLGNADRFAAFLMEIDQVLQLIIRIEGLEANWLVLFSVHSRSL